MLRTLPLLLAGLLLATGCAHPPGVFRLTAPPNAPLMIPPAVKDATVVRATVSIPRIPKGSRCEPSAHGLLVEHKGPTGARVLVTVDALRASTPTELFAWTLNLEKQGCLPLNESARLAENIIDALPLDPGKRSQLLQGRSDLKSVHALRVVAPILKEQTAGPLAEIQSVRQGANPASLDVEVKTNPAVIGYEIDWYDFAPQENGPGYRIVTRGAEKHVDGRVENASTPSISRFEFGPAARWYELYMMTKVSSNDFDFVVFSAKTSEELQTNIAAFRSDAAKFLQTADHGSYTVLPHGSGINAYMRVGLNGKLFDLPKGATIRQAIEQGQADPRAALATLKVRKLHDGKLYPVQWDAGSDQILSLALEGGEELEW